MTNLTAFGAFVDIGVPKDGLVHLSPYNRVRSYWLKVTTLTGEERRVFIATIFVFNTGKAVVLRDISHRSPKPLNDFSISPTLPMNIQQRFLLQGNIRKINIMLCPAPAIIDEGMQIEDRLTGAVRDFPEDQVGRYGRPSVDGNTRLPVSYMGIRFAPFRK